jgi:hypothetical protein
MCFLIFVFVVISVFFNTFSVRDWDYGDLVPVVPRTGSVVFLPILLIGGFLLFSCNH